MPKKPDEVELREMPKRPFGVYVLVFILLIGVFVAALEIFRVNLVLGDVWLQADEFLRDYSGLVDLAADFIVDPTVATIVNSLIVLVWLTVIVGLWLLQRWAWVTLMIITGFLLVYALFRYINGEPDYISMVTNVATVFYLNDYSVQRAFAPRRLEQRL